MPSPRKVIMSKENKVKVDVNREEVTVAILNYSDSNVHIETITIWWEAEESWGTTNRYESIEAWIDKQGFNLSKIEWMECSTFSIETNKCTLTRRKV